MAHGGYAPSVDGDKAVEAIAERTRSRFFDTRRSCGFPEISGHPTSEAGASKSRTRGAAQELGSNYWLGGVYNDVNLYPKISCKRLLGTSELSHVTHIPQSYPHMGVCKVSAQSTFEYPLQVRIRKGTVQAILQNGGIIDGHCVRYLIGRRLIDPFRDEVSSVITPTSWMSPLETY